MSQIRLTEGGDSRTVRLERAQAELLRTSPLVVLTPSMEPGAYVVGPGSKVGVARIGDLQVTVQPKVAIDRLLFMMGYAIGERRIDWQALDVHLERARDLLPTVAGAFSRLATRALRQGLLQGYREVEDSLPVLRGRVRAGDQLRQRFGLAVPLEVRYDDFTVDISENRILLAAVLRCMRIPGIDRGTRQRLLRLRPQLNDVTPLASGSPTPYWRLTRLNARYGNALGLAEVTLRGESFEHEYGGVAATGYMFDMWRIFEDFVCAALRERIAAVGGRALLQDALHLDEAEEVQVKPDLVWRAGGLPVAVVDAKYKAERPDGFPDVDLYQVLAYCTVLGLRRGHLIYAKGNEEGRTHVVRRSGVTIHCHTLDLSDGPDGLLAQVRTIVDRIGFLRQREAA